MGPYVYAWCFENIRKAIFKLLLCCRNYPSGRIPRVSPASNQEGPLLPYRSGDALFISPSVWNNNSSSIIKNLRKNAKLHFPCNVINSFFQLCSVVFTLFVGVEGDWIPDNQEDFKTWRHVPGCRRYPWLLSFSLRRERRMRLVTSHRALPRSPNIVITNLTRKSRLRI